MSYVVSTGMAAFCHGEDHPRSVPVAPGGMPAGFAPEGSFTQPGAQLVSREALRAGHRGVSGRDQHHLPARPLATFGQGPLGRTDRGVSGLACHRGLGQEQRPEVLNGDHLVVVHDPPGPDAGRVGVLPGGLLVQLRRLAPGPPVSAGWGVPALAPPAGHLPLGLGQFGGAAFPVTAVRQVIGGIGSGGGGSDTPVNADRAAGFWRWRWLAGDDERGVPVAKAVPVDADAGRFGRQFPGLTKTVSRISWQPLAGPRWRLSSAMSKTSGTSECRPFLPTAETRGFPGGSR